MALGYVLICFTTRSGYWEHSNKLADARKNGETFDQISHYQLLNNKL